MHTFDKLQKAAMALVQIAEARERGDIFYGRAVEHTILQLNEQDIIDATAAHEFSEACDREYVRRIGEMG